MFISVLGIQGIDGVVYCSNRKYGKEKNGIYFGFGSLFKIWMVEEMVERLKCFWGQGDSLSLGVKVRMNACGDCIFELWGL